MNDRGEGAYTMLTKIGKVTVEAVLDNTVNGTTNPTLYNGHDLLGNYAHGVFAVSSNGTILRFIDIEKCPKDTVVDCIKDYSSKMTSIYLPILVTGNHPMKSTRILHDLISGLQKYLSNIRQTHSCLRFVRFVVLHQSVMSLFKSVMPETTDAVCKICNHATGSSSSFSSKSSGSSSSFSSKSSGSSSSFSSKSSGSSMTNPSGPGSSMTNPSGPGSSMTNPSGPGGFLIGHLPEGAIPVHSIQDFWRLVRVGQHIAIREAVTHHALISRFNAERTSVQVVHRNSNGIRKDEYIKDIKLAAAHKLLYIVPYRCDMSEHDLNMTILRAFSKVGCKCYNALSKNCEHFVNWCLYGEHRSEQVTRIFGGGSTSF